jgi:hypothetical protein
MDLPERFCKRGTTKPVKTEQSNHHSYQGRRIKDRSRYVCYRVNDLYLAHGVCGLTVFLTSQDFSKPLSVSSSLTDAQSNPLIQPS